MNVPFSVKVPVALAVRLHEREKVLRAAHQKDLEKFMKRKEAGGNPEQIAISHRALLERGRAISMHNLLRVALSFGIDAVEAMKDADLISALADGGIVKGRPRRAA